jgi:hypothetical protein
MMRSSVPPAPSLWSGLIRAVSLALLAVAVVYVIFQVTRPSEVERLQAQPEFSLYYPGSVLLREGGNGPSWMGVVAHTWRRIRTDAAEDVVLAFYREELRDRGWLTSGGSTVILHEPFETRACAWHNSEMILRLSFLNVDEVVKFHPEDADAVTIYELGLFDRTSSLSSLACLPKA